jgi:hypothetical protein
MIGDKRLNMPGTIEDTKEIYKYFGLYMGNTNLTLLSNAERLAYLNNEVYDRLHMRPMKYQAKRGESEFLNER